jgi:hypothetical protein
MLAIGLADGGGVAGEGIDHGLGSGGSSLI